jgi:hypothetical protein
LGIKILAKLNPTIEKLIKFTLEKQKFPKFSQFICQKMAIFFIKNAATDHDLIGFIYALGNVKFNSWMECDLIGFI